jgi:predicted transcriptional regulator
MNKTEVFTALSHPNRRRLFDYVASNGGWFPSDLVSTTGLSLKQFYSGMTMLKDAGLIRRESGKYYLTSFGRVVFECAGKIESASATKWALNLLDESEAKLTEEQYNTVSKALIPDEEIRGIMMLAPNAKGGR